MVFRIFSSVTGFSQNLLKFMNMTRQYFYIFIIQH
jgi:hypothetical protein